MLENMAFTTLFVIVALFSVLLALLSLKKRKKEEKSGSKFEDTGDLSASPNTYLHIKVPKSYEETAIEARSAPVAAEQMFASLHGLLAFTPDIQEHVSFEISATKDGVSFYCGVPEHLRPYVESQIYAQYPDAQIKAVEDYMPDRLPDNHDFESIYLTLSKEDFFPLKTFRDFEVDPLAALTSALDEVKQRDNAYIQVVVRPIADVWQDNGYAYVELIRSGASAVGLGVREIFKDIANEFFTIFGSLPKKVAYSEEDGTLGKKPVPVEKKLLTDGQRLELESIENKLSKMGFETIVRIGVCGDKGSQVKNHLKSLSATFKQFSTSNLNSFIPSSRSSYEDFKNRVFIDRESFILSTEELASLFHLPSASLETPSIDWSLGRHGEPPVNLPTDDSCTKFGYTNFRNRRIEFGLRNDNDDRDKHVYLIGKTGTGKSTVFKNMIAQDMRKGFGLGVLDPHGDLVDDILEYVPDDRVDDVIVFDPSDFEKPIGMNMLELSDPSQKNLMASGLLSVFKKHFGFSWGPRLEYLLNYAILTLLEVPGTTMLGVVRLLSDDNYRKYILYNIKDPIIHEFWEKEFKGMKGSGSLMAEALSPIQNKVGRFLSSSTIRNILGQRNSAINLRDVMDSKKILLMNLSKGKIGEDNANLLGSLLVSRLFFMAMQRVNVPQEERVPFYLYVDEFQNFASEAFAGILSEARKYRLSLNLTHQYTSQIPEEMQQAIFGNVGTIIALTLGAQDAKILAPEFAPAFDENDLISLERHHFYVKLMIDGMTSAPFSGGSLPPPSKDVYTDNKDKILRASREKYGRDKKEVEEKIKIWVERRFDLGMAIAEEHRRRRTNSGEEDDSSSKQDLKNDGEDKEKKIEGSIKVS